MTFIVWGNGTETTTPHHTLSWQDILRRVDSFNCFTTTPSSMMARTTSTKVLAAIALLVLLQLAVFVPPANAGFAAYGICQTGCNMLTVTCFAVGGLVFGTVTGGASAPAAALTCSKSQGVCMMACVAAGCMPTP